MEAVKSLPDEGPKFAMPLSYIVMDAETRDFISRLVPEHIESLVKYTADRGNVILARDQYIDCVRCRQERIDFAKGRPDYFSSDKRKDQTRYQFGERTFHCNDCQGTGWVSESPKASQERHQYVTSEMRLSRMTIPELEAVVKAGVTSLYSSYEIMRVLLQRLKEAVTPLSQRS